MGCLIAGMAYVALTHTRAFLVVSSGLVVLLGLGHLQAKREKRQLLALASQRPGESICEFARDFATREIDTWVIRAVYEQLQSRLKHIHPAFPIRADDRLKEDLGLDDDDLDLDLAPQVAMRTGRPIDTMQTNPYYGKVTTVRSLVLCFHHQPKSKGAL